jgi:16S rRNA (cytosine967-C5)-methyltransferase
VEYRSVIKRKPRENAVRVLLQRDRRSASIESLLADELSGLAPADRHLCQELVYGVCRQQALLDWLISRKSRQSNPPPALTALLRLGIYQLFWLDRVPDHAVVHETVEMTRSFGVGTQSGYVNAILRAYSRERAETRVLIDRLKSTQPHLGYSHPEWLCARWTQRWGRESTRQLLEWNNTAPSTFARVNQLRTDPGRLLLQWREENVSYDFIRHDWIPENHMFKLQGHPALQQMPSFQQGGFYVQDPSTLLAVFTLDPQPGEAILDLCAAPGGKTTHIAQLTANQSHILACDPDPDRINLLRQNCARLGVTCVATHLLPLDPSGELSAPIPGLGKSRFNRVLIDAPCSNTGVMRRRVDLRWRIRPEEIQRLSRLQASLLRRGAAALEPGGVLIYSTCSLEPEENEELIRAFLVDHPDFQLEHQRALVPFTDQVDGSYVARLRARGAHAPSAKERPSP